MVVLEGCPYVGVSLYSLQGPSGFGGRTGFDVSTSHTLPQGVLVAVTLVGGGARDGGARARAMCESGLPLCSVVITALLRAGSGPQVLEQKP